MASRARRSVAGDLGEGGCGLIVLALRELSLAQGEKCGGVVGGVLYGHLQTLDALLRCGCVGAADVVFKGAELDVA